MAESKIEWTGRSDWNPVRGCTRVSPGCGGPGPHGGCYAEAIAARFSDPGQAFHGFASRTAAGGRWSGRVEVQWNRLTLPLGWRKPAVIFANSTSDLFHEKLPAHEIASIYAVAVAAHHLRGHTIQIVTKRADRARHLLTDEAFWDQVNAEAGAHVTERVDPLNRRSDDARATLEDYGPEKPAPGVWLGVSVENQEWADRRREELRATPAAVRFVSYEPALARVDWTGWEFLDWLISGGESGQRARPSHPDWHRNARDFCAAHGIAYLFKQWGEWGVAASALSGTPGRYAIATPAAIAPDSWGGRVFEVDAYPRQFDLFSGSVVRQRIGKKAAGRRLDGVQHDGAPA